MGWPTFSGTWPTVTAAFAGENELRVRRPTRAQDASGGRTLTYSAWSSPTYMADIKPMIRRVDEVDAFARENIIARYQVTMGARFDARDQFLWVDADIILTVIASVAVGTVAARQWMHVCEEHH